MTKRLQKLEKFLTDDANGTGLLSVLENLIELDEKLDEKDLSTSQKIELVKEELKEIIASIKFPETKDHTEDFEKLMSKLDEEDEVEVTLTIV